MIKLKKLLLIIIICISLTSCTLDTLNNKEAQDSLQDIKAEFHFLNVGQGDCTLIKLGKYVVLVDAGPDTAESYIIKYLTDMNIKDIDLLIVTHPHDDHIAALASVLKSFNVKRIIDSGYYHPNKYYKTYEAALAQELLLGAKYSEDEDLKIEISEDMYIEIFENGDDWQEVNNQSVVSKITCGEVELLLTGDLEKEGEQALIESAVNINADILAAGHHGSITANTKKFVQSVNPQYTVISAGLDNKYGLPHDEVCNMFKNQGIKMFETAYYGTIVLKTDGKIIKRESLNDKYHLEITKVDKVNETVTIKNNSNKTIDLSDWYLLSYAGNQKYNFPEGYILKQGAEVNITSGKNAYEDGTTNLKWTTKNIWSNSKRDPAYLYNKDKNMIIMKE